MVKSIIQKLQHGYTQYQQYLLLLLLIFYILYLYKKNPNKLQKIANPFYPHNMQGGLKMRLVCSKENLTEGINIVQKAVSSKSTMQILEGILLEASENFKLTGNDMELGIECIVDADIQEKGSIVINSKMFGDIVRRLPDSEILIEVKENNLVIIECENSHFEVKGLSSAGFPAIPEIQKDNFFKISQKVIKEMIKQTLFAGNR